MEENMMGVLCCLSFCRKWGQNVDCLFLFLVTPDFSLVVSYWFLLLLYAIGFAAPLAVSGIFCAPSKLKNSGYLSTDPNQFQ